MPGGDVILRFRKHNPEAWERRHELKCLTCDAEPGTDCWRLDGSGTPSSITHILRLESTARMILGEARQQRQAPREEGETAAVRC